MDKELADLFAKVEKKSEKGTETPPEPKKEEPEQIPPTVPKPAPKPPKKDDKPEILCYICGKPVDIATAKSGIGGKPCHGECFVKESKKKEISEKKEEPKKEEPTTQSLSSLFTGKSDEDFDLSPSRGNPKHIITVFGLKGAGKSSFSFTFPESHGCLSFDNKSLPISEQMDKRDKIVVFNGARYLDKSSPDAYLESASRSWRYLNKILDTIHDGKVKDSKGNIIYDESMDSRPDWMVVDGGEIFQQMAEMVMRYNNNLQPYQGMANLNLWKERNMYIDQLLLKCTAKSKKGVIWTTYIKKDEIVKQGNTEISDDIPKWIASVLRETDVVIKVERETKKTGQRFYATVETSKWKKIPESARTDITRKGVEILTEGQI